MTDALSAWENEGGALAWPSAGVPRGTDSDVNEILRHLGAAVVEHWNELPQHFKQNLFRELSAQPTGLSQKSLKERMARYLHVNGRPDRPRIELRPIMRSAE